MSVPTSRQQHPPPMQSRPCTISPTFRAALSLPRRLLNPPTPRGKLSSWGITPRFTVTLDDILDRRHLPPLGLKDFEEWLLFVEHASENLYFILWLREYTARFDAWIQLSKGARSPLADSADTNSYRAPAPTRPPPNPGLLSFYIRAKQTFLVEGAPYELVVPADALAPFLTSQAYPYDCSLPPDPLVFAELSSLARTALAESLARFVRATFANVDAPRAVCGCYGGTIIALLGSIPPIVASVVLGGSRWWRLFALPGLWLGLTVFIAAMYGVCMMIYLFGDLRQLRSFELLRPSAPSSSYSHTGPGLGKVGWLSHYAPPEISPPLPATLLTSAVVEGPGIVPVASVQAPPGEDAAPSGAGTHRPHLTVICPPSRWSTPSVYSQPSREGGCSDEYGSTYEYGSEEYNGESEADTSSDARIHISDAFYDECPLTDTSSPGSALQTATASFIRPYVYRGDDREDLERGEGPRRAALSVRLPVDAFDFDALPPPPARRRSVVQAPTDAPQVPSPVYARFPAMHTIDSSNDAEKAQGNADAPLRVNFELSRPAQRPAGPRAFLSMLQSRCAPSNIVRTRFAGGVGFPVSVTESPEAHSPIMLPPLAFVVPSPSTPTPTLTASSGFPPSPASVWTQKFAGAREEGEREDEVKGREGLREKEEKMSWIPAQPFAKPLTPVLSPLVSRAQWEIVVRSAVLAALVSVLCEVVVVAVPERGR